MKHVIERFITMRTQDVLNTFADLPHATVAQDYVFVPGFRDEPLLLVGHADTVFDAPPEKMEWYGNLARAPYNYKKRVGLGADDRVGIAMLWLMRNHGHSILITDLEESGGIGAKSAADELKDVLSEHQFAVEVDRAHDQEMVFYDVSTAAFRRYMEECTGFRTSQGSYTDIVDVCSGIGICGVNIAAGYWDQHTTSEMFSYDAWLRTHNVLRRMCTQEAAHPRFALPAVRRPKWKFSRYDDYSHMHLNWASEKWAKGASNKNLLLGTGATDTDDLLLDDVDLDDADDLTGVNDDLPYADRVLGATRRPSLHSADESEYPDVFGTLPSNR